MPEKIDFYIFESGGAFGEAPGFTEVTLHAGKTEKTHNSGAVGVGLVVFHGIMHAFYQKKFFSHFGIHMVRQQVRHLP